MYCDDEFGYKSENSDKGNGTIIDSDWGKKTYLRNGNKNINHVM